MCALRKLPHIFSITAAITCPITLMGCSSAPSVTEPSGDIVPVNSIIPVPVNTPIASQVMTTTPLLQATHVETNKNLNASTSVSNSLSSSDKKFTLNLSNLTIHSANDNFTFIVLPGGKQRTQIVLHSIIPAGWDLLLSEKISASKFVSWTGNDQWPYVLNKLAQANNWYITANEDRHTVLVQNVAEHAPVVTMPVKAPQKLVTPVPSKPAIMAASPVAKSIQPPAPPVPTNPFKGSLATTAAAAPLSAKTPAPVATSKPLTTTTTAIAPKPVIAPKPATKPIITPAKLVEKTWVALTGQTLKDTMFQWAANADCSVAGTHWTVMWQTSVNYRIDAPLHFTGAFKDALNGIFQLYQGASVPLYAGTNSMQCVLKVDDKPIHQ